MKNKRPEQTENEISHSQEKRNVLYSIIIPCYRSSKTIRKVVELDDEGAGSDRKNGI